MQLLKLIALDTDDLEIVSAHLQDSIIQVKDLQWFPAEKRFIVALKRFSWETETAKAFITTGKKPSERRLCALRFDCVVSLRAMGIDRNRPDDVLSLLALKFIEFNKPGGTVEFIFSGNAGLRLEVECIEAELTDFGPVWEASGRPEHPV